MNPETMRKNDPNVWIAIDGVALNKVARDLSCDSELTVTSVNLDSNSDGELVVMLTVQKGKKTWTLPVPYRWLALRLKINARVHHKCQPFVVAVNDDDWCLGYYIAARVDNESKIHWEGEIPADDGQLDLGDEE